MKKYIAFVLAVVCLIGMIGCTVSHPVARVGSIDEDVSEIRILYTVGGTQTEWILEGEELQFLRDWADKREYQTAEFEEGKYAGDTEGGQSYQFLMEGSTLPDFSYIVNGTDAHYLLVQGNWYFVANPELPPVTQLPAAVSFYGKVLEINEHDILVEPAEDSLERKSSDKIIVPVDTESAQLTLQVGDTVKIIYDGMIQELYPAILPNVSNVEKLSS